MATMLTDWRTIANDREKYSAYLCSREWCEKREAVRERSGGICERCKTLPMDACHHLTYERKYNERIEDLQAICTPCHEFTHGKSDFDPCANENLLRFMLNCKSDGLRPIPVEFLCGLAPPNNHIETVMLIREAVLAANRFANYFDPEIGPNDSVGYDFMCFCDNAAGFAFLWPRIEKRYSLGDVPLIQNYVSACKAVGVPSSGIPSDFKPSIDDEVDI